MCGCVFRRQTHKEWRWKGREKWETTWQLHSHSLYNVHASFVLGSSYMHCIKVNPKLHSMSSAQNDTVCLCIFFYCLQFVLLACISIKLTAYLSLLILCREKKKKKHFQQEMRCKNCFFLCLAVGSALDWIFLSSRFIKCVFELKQAELKEWFFYPPRFLCADEVRTIGSEPMYTKTKSRI